MKKNILLKKKINLSLILHQKRTKKNLMKINIIMKTINIMIYQQIKKIKRLLKKQIKRQKIKSKKQYLFNYLS